MRPMTLPRFLFLGAMCCLARPLAAQIPLPPLPDSAGWGVHVLTIARDPRGAVWVGTYGEGMYVLDAGADGWRPIRRDTSGTSISWDFVHAIAFGPRGQVWYGTIGNGWGLSLDGGATWRNWTYSDLGPNWQYVAPSGIATRGDTTWIATADGIQETVDDGRHWTALVDTVGPAVPGPADTALPVLTNEYIRRLALNRRGILVQSLRGPELYRRGPDGSWDHRSMTYAPFPPTAGLVLGGSLIRGSNCGFRVSTDTTPCLHGSTRPAQDSLPLKTTWFRRPIGFEDNPFIDQTYRYGSTMGGNFQQHQGVEFNNPDGTAVRAIGAGTVVYAGPAEAGALTVAIKHDSTLRAAGQRLRIYSVYYHNSALMVHLGQRVAEGTQISRVGNTGRATNDHLHLEVHAAATDDVHLIVDSLERYPRYTTNPELWIEPIPGTGVVAGVVRDDLGRPIPQARIYGLVKFDPVETPYSFAETYGDRAHGHPAYDEDFAVSDVPPGTYVLGVEINGQRIYRTVTVYPGRLSWVNFRP